MESSKASISPSWFVSGVDLSVYCHCPSPRARARARYIFYRYLTCCFPFNLMLVGPC